MSRHTVNLVKGKKEFNLVVGLDPVLGQSFYSLSDNKGTLLGNSVSGESLQQALAKQKIDLRSVNGFLNSAIAGIEAEEFQRDLKKMGEDLPEDLPEIDLNRVVEYPLIQIAETKPSSPKM